MKDLISAETLEPSLTNLNIDERIVNDRKMEGGKKFADNNATAEK